jgi:hypothetical protein
MPSLKELRQDLRDTEREADNLLKMQKRPNLTPEKLEIFRQLHRSARAEVALRQKAIDHATNIERHKSQ